MNMRFSLSDKISMTIIVMGAFSIILIYYISNSYKQFTYQHHAQEIQQLAYLESNDLIEELKSNTLDLAMAIEHEDEFNNDYRYKQKDGLTEQLDNQFYQYFVTAGVIQLLKLYILDTDFSLISISKEGVNTDLDGELICPQLSQLSLTRSGTEKLQTLSRTCLYKNKPVFAVIVPFGGLNPTGYIQIVTDLAYNLKKIEQSLAMPIQMNLLNGEPIYQSEDWSLTQRNKNHLSVSVPILNNDKEPIMHISLMSDMTVFNREITEHRNFIMALAFVVTALAVFIVLFILRQSTIPPLAGIYDTLQQIHSHPYNDNGDDHLLFEQLLEQIIELKRKFKTGFSVMILDLTHFRKINSDYGNAIGDQLLIEVEQRLNKILRNTDLISWVGTDTPGHKLLPSDTKTQYRATIARLGGDEFGLLLPSAQTQDQANAVAKRIVKALNKSFHIKNHNIDIGCTIGISIYPEHGENEKILIRNADKAMYNAKANNQTVCVFEPESENRQ
jgi:GGDEF domain-containing protein